MLGGAPAQVGLALVGMQEVRCVEYVAPEPTRARTQEASSQAPGLRAPVPAPLLFPCASVPVVVVAHRRCLILSRSASGWLNAPPARRVCRNGRQETAP